MDGRFVNYELKISRLRRSLLYTVLGMSLFGTLLVYDASSIYAWFNFYDAMYFLKRQFVFIVLGCISMLLVLRLNIDYLRRYSKALLILGLVMLISVLLFGQKVAGARRWLKFFGFGFQPSEFIKIIFLVYLADYFARKRNQMSDILRGIMPVLSITGFISLLIFLEPDFGNAIFLGLVLLIFLFTAKIPKKYFTMIIIGFLFVFIVLVSSSPYRRARIMSYLNPWADSQGSGFQLVQSQIGIGSGGILGLGIGESKQKLFFLPAAHTDFIFSIIAEEFGFIGSILILFFYVFIFLQGLRILKWTNDYFRYYLGWGALIIIALQAFINVSVAIGIMPTKGMPLPFISYGGSSTIVGFILLGLFLNATREA